MFYYSRSSNMQYLCDNCCCTLVDILTGDLDLILEVVVSALNVDRIPPLFFLLAVYTHVALSGERAHTSAWNDVTVNTPTRLNTAFVCLLT